jgi:hypothetical protein
MQRRLWWIWLVIALTGTVCIIFALLLSWRGSVLYSPERKDEITSALTAIGRGMHNRRDSVPSDQMQALLWLDQPPQGQDFCNSWRFSLLPFMEHMDAKETRISWTVTRFADYCHPTYCLTPHRNRAGHFTTNCLAIVGPGTLAHSSLATYEDDAILVVAVARTEIAWGLRGDLSVDAAGNLIDKWPGPIDDAWIGVCFADARSWLLDKVVPLEKLQAFFTVAKARKHDANEVLGPYRIDGPLFPRE